MKEPSRHSISHPESLERFMAHPESLERPMARIAW